ncbi:MAG: hypothetical protein J6G98_04215 [Bacilli bacterium]|nr:hypothetical protein [Bacilli bacterium]
MKKVLLFIISLLFITGCSSKDNHINAKVNNNELILKEQVIDSLKFSDISLMYEKGTSTFRVTITNTGEKISPESLNIIFKSKSDSVITILDGTFGEIDKGTSIDLTLTSDVDLSDAYKIEYEIK